MVDPFHRFGKADGYLPEHILKGTWVGEFPT
ncbi:hypothetical protein QFZ76_004777 [Streptomyces sp. V4I2]|nr:hypothetical protein [Streptomyces sp. V4I2]